MPVVFNVLVLLRTLVLVLVFSLPLLLLLPLLLFLLLIHLLLPGVPSDVHLLFLLYLTFSFFLPISWDFLGFRQWRKAGSGARQEGIETLCRL